MFLFVLIFIAVPVAELALLIEVGGRIGTLPTLGLIVVTGIVGASLARMQGLAVLRRIHADMSRGKLPASALVDGVIILMAAALLITPGILTDVLGFLCLIPLFRSVVRRLAWDWIRAQVERQRIRVRMGEVNFGGWPKTTDKGPVYDIEPEEIDEDPH